MTDDAFPTIFPNLPKYLSSQSSVTKRIDPQERKRKYHELENKKYENWLEEDTFNNLDEIIDQTSKFRNEQW